MSGKMVLSDAMKEILSHITEGIHVIDTNGVTLYYNQAMAEIEGLEEAMVTGKPLVDVYPDWTAADSTLLTVIKTGKPILDEEQLYLNFKGEKITTLNSTYPIYQDGELTGAVEISANHTHVSEMSERIVELQQRLLKDQKKTERTKTYHFTQIVGRHENFMKAIQIARRASKTSSSVLIYGDTGTGKELFAQSIHYESKRRNRAFIAQNCAALPESLLESLLFGSTRGSFTGAVDRPGLFEQADGGTLFLDEINSMSHNLQAKLLRALQENYIRRIGGDRDIPVDVRIISATNESPDKLLENKIIRKDLFYRINVIPIHIPSLAERREDIPLLVDHFIREFNTLLGKDVWMVSDELINRFMDYAWVGNIRELKNFIESSMNMMDPDEHVITPEHMPAHVGGVLNAGNSGGVQKKYSDFPGLKVFLEEKEREIIEEFMSMHENNITHAANALGISRQNLQYKLKGLEKK